MRRLLFALAVASLPGHLPASEQEATRTALETVARETGVAAASIEVVSTQAVEWPDANLGCRTGVEAVPQVTAGYRVLLRAAGKLYAVNAAADGTLGCASGLGVSGGVQHAETMQPKEPEPTDPASLALVASAREDLSRRLSVAPGDITFVAFKSVVWPDSSLGCPRPDMMYTQVQRDGFLIRFEVSGRSYQYHGGSGRAPFLCESPAETELPTGK
jgi:hypothetical protein